MEVIHSTEHVTLSTCELERAGTYVQGGPRPAAVMGLADDRLRAGAGGRAGGSETTNERTEKRNPSKVGEKDIPSHPIVDSAASNSPMGENLIWGPGSGWGMM